MTEKVNWIQMRGYSIDAQLHSEGLSFEAFDLIVATLGAQAAAKMKRKVIGKLCSELRAACDEEHEIDISKIQYGCYVICLGGPFQLKYGERHSRVAYIGSGAVYNRIKSHLSGKLFDFASELRTVPMRFYFADLSHLENGKRLQRVLEQQLLNKFRREVDEAAPLLNKNDAAKSVPTNSFEVGWDLPVQKDRGRSIARWKLEPADYPAWKGAL